MQVGYDWDPGKFSGIVADLAGATAIAIDRSDLLLANHSRYLPYALAPRAKGESYITIFKRDVRQWLDLSFDTFQTRSISQTGIAGKEVWLENIAIHASEYCE